MMYDPTDWRERGDPDCECCMGDGLQADGENECPCVKRFASPDREAFRRLNNAAYAAIRVAGRDHPEAALILQAIRITDLLVDRTAPPQTIGGE